MFVFRIESSPQPCKILSLLEILADMSGSINTFKIRELRPLSDINNSIGSRTAAAGNMGAAIVAHVADRRYYL